MQTNDEGNPAVHNLKYATIANDRYNIQVKTWEETGHHFAQMSVNGTVLSYDDLGPVGE